MITNPVLSFRPSYSMSCYRRRASFLTVSHLHPDCPRQMFGRFYDSRQAPAAFVTCRVFNRPAIHVVSLPTVDGDIFVNIALPLQRKQQEPPPPKKTLLG